MHGHKKAKLCNFNVSVRSGTFLQGVKLPAWKILLFCRTYLEKNFSLSHGSSQLTIADNTAVNWVSFCGEVCEYWLQTQDAIGWPGMEVEIDETAISRRKYNRGRVLRTVWLFGGIKRVEKKFFIAPLITDAAKGDRPDVVPRSGDVIVDHIKKIHSSRFGDLQWHVERIRLPWKDWLYAPLRSTIPRNLRLLVTQRSTHRTSKGWRRDVKEWIQRPGMDPLPPQEIPRQLRLLQDRDWCTGPPIPPGC